MLNVKTIKIVTTIALSLIVISLISYLSPTIRLEHFSFEFVILGVIINGLFLWALLTQISIGREANEIALHAAIDARAPTLVPKINISAIEFARHKAGVICERGDSVFHFKVPKDNDTILSFRITGSLKNEGKTTARLHTQGNVTFDTTSVQSSELLWTPNTWNEDEEVLLEPGATIKFAWIDAHKVKDWAGAFKNNVEGRQADFDENSSCKIQFRYWDFQHSAYDYIDIEVQGYPLKPEGGVKDQYKLDQNGLSTSIYPTQRLYRDKERIQYISPYNYRRK